LLLDECNDYVVLLAGPGPFDEVGVENLLPAVEALDISSVMKVSSYLLSVPRTVSCDQFLQLFILLRCPPALLDKAVVVLLMLVLDFKLEVEYVEEEGRHLCTGSSRFASHLPR